MCTDDGVRILAGTFILVSLALAHFVSPWWLCFTAFVGVNLIQSAFTHFCPAEMLLQKAGLKPRTGGSGCCGG